MAALKTGQMIGVTERLILRRLTADDAPFILELLNEPAFLEFIGDKGVRTLDDARHYILTGPVASYDRHGFGLYLVLLKAGEVPIGTCGLLKRDALPDVDIGYALRSAFWGHGYAFEAASAVLAHGRNAFGLRRIVAIVTPGNLVSKALLEKLGLRYERTLSLSRENDTDLFAIEAPGAP
jgi:ribosomal-protein-alanine N-acetyltransferase